MRSLGKSFIYNFILTFINMIYPLLTAPYLSSVLGAQNIGKVNYAMSLVNWFLIIAAFGIPLYGVREIARSRDDRYRLTEVFQNLFLIQFVFSIISFVLYLFIVLSLDVVHGEMNLHIAVSVILVLNIFSVDWFFKGIEEFRFIAIRNLVVKVISIVLIFIMIKDRDNYVLYSLINILGLSLNNVFSFIRLFGFIEKRITSIKVFYYLRELSGYFAISFVVAMYTALDQSIIGALNTKSLAFYMRSKVILGVGISLTSAISNALAPRTAYLSKIDFKEYLKVLNDSISAIYMVSIPCFLGIFILAENIMFFLGGEEFREATLCLRVISPLVVVISIGIWQGGQVILANKKDKAALMVTIVAMVISISLNIYFIPRYMHVGAALVWVIAEFVTILVKYVYILKNLEEIKIKYISKSFFKYLLAGAFMLLIILGIKFLIENVVLELIVSIFVGALVYGICLVFLREDLVLSFSKVFMKKLKR